MSLSPPVVPVPPDSSSMVDLGELWRYKWRIVAITTLFVAAGVGYLFVSPTVYEVSCRVAVREDTPAIEQPLGLANREFLATQAEVIRSPLIIREALADAPITLPETYEKSASAFVLETLAVTPIIQTEVLKISYRSENEDEAKALVAALVTKFEEHVRQDDRSRHAEELELLTRREAELRDQLAVLQQQRAVFRRDSPLVGQSRESLTLEANQLAESAQRLSEARARRMALENKLKSYVVAKSNLNNGEDDGAVVPASLATEANSPRILPTRSLTTPANDPSTNLLRDVSNAEGVDFTDIHQQLWQARIAFQNLSNKYTPEHPEMVGAEDRVRYWEELLAQRVHAAEMGLSLELAAAETTEANLRNFLAEEQARVKQLDNYLVEEEAFVAKIARLEESHANSLTRLNEYQLTEKALETGRSSVTVQLLDGPELQEEVVWPQPKLLLGLSGILGLVAGVVLVSLRTR
ncbi:MAG: Wzz/FepE/Etk N-terminal domain-containing protein [Pirellulales bacterium]